MINKFLKSILISVILIAGTLSMIAYLQEDISSLETFLYLLLAQLIIYPAYKWWYDILLTEPKKVDSKATLISMLEYLIMTNEIKHNSTIQKIEDLLDEHKRTSN